MTLYIDRHNGVWLYLELTDPGFEHHHWKLVSRSLAHSLAEFSLGNHYNDKSVRHLAPFIRVDDPGQAYEFPFPSLTTGVHVLVDATVIEQDYFNFVNSNSTGDGFIGTYVGEHGDGLFDVNLTVSVPAGSVERLGIDNV